MKAVTIRTISDGTLVCFGPDNGQYDPGFDKATSTKQHEADYDAVLTEWTATPKASNPRETAKASLRNAKTLPDVLAALEQLL